MSITEGTQPAVLSWTGAWTTAQTTASFTPETGALLVALLSADSSASGGTGTGSITDSLSGTWTLLKRQNTNDGTVGGLAEVWCRDSPGSALTVSATGSAQTTNGGQLTVRTLIGAKVTASQNGATAGAIFDPAAAVQASVAAGTGNKIYGAALNWTASTAMTVLGNTTAIAAVVDNTNGDNWASFKSTGDTAGTATYGYSTSTQGQLAAVEIIAAPAAGGMTGRARPGQTWRRYFQHRQAYPQPSPVTAAAGVSGQTQPQPTFPLPRRILARAVWRGGSGTVGIRGSVQPQPTFPLPRRKLSRGFWGGLAGTTGIRGSVQPRPTVTQPRRNPYARAVWHGISGGIAPGGTTQPWPTIPVPRRRPARAVIQFTPVTTTNQVPPAAPSGTVQPQPTTTPPRLHPSRAYIRFTPVTTINAGIPGQTQPWPTIEIPRRRPGRAVIEFTPVTTTNQVVAGISGTVQPRATLTWPRRKPVRAYTAVTYHPVRTTNAPPAAFVPALSPTGAGGSIEGELWRMARDGDWPTRPPGFGPVGEVPTTSAPREQASGRGWVGKKVRRFFWPREED